MHFIDAPHPAPTTLALLDAAPTAWTPPLDIAQTMARHALTEFHTTELADAATAARLAFGLAANLDMLLDALDADATDDGNGWQKAAS